MSHHIAHAVPNYITHELAILRLWCGMYRQRPEEFVRRHGARFEERHGQLSRTRCRTRIARTDERAAADASKAA